MKLDEISDPRLKARILQADQEQNGARVRKLETRQPQSTAAPSLASRPKQRQASQSRVVVCALVAYRKRILDDDNNIASLKPLRDGIAESLGIDDGNRCIRFEYSQVLTKGVEGCAVKIDANL